MRNTSRIARLLSLFIVAVVVPGVRAQEASTVGAAGEGGEDPVARFDRALDEAGEESSEARQRLAVRRVIRDAEGQLASAVDPAERFPLLGFLFRARQQLIALDDGAEHREALIETCRELVEAPAEFAGLRLEADLLLSQAELAKQGANAETRAQALRPFVDRYLDTPVASKVLRLAMVMALELGDNGLVTDLQEMIEVRFAGDLEMIAFQRDRLGGQVFGAPFTGLFERSDGKTVRFPMDGLGRSTLLVFWSEEEGGLQVLKGIAEAAQAMREELAGRLDFISFNLDELPDAGESIVRGLGVDWQVLHLPGGRANPIYGAYVRADPQLLTVSPTGYTALVMSGSTRRRVDADGEPDYGRMFQSSLARQWTEPRYTMHIAALMAGDFMVLDPEGGIDPARPPELKALAEGEVAKPLVRVGGSVPEETLRAIQDSFVAPPRRYRLSHAEARESYVKAAGLCRATIAAHPGAPDLWIVRNRLIIALLGLWKTDAAREHLEAAIGEAQAALAAGYPDGCEVVARFCLARGALLDPSVRPQEVIDQLLADCGGESAPGPAIAAAALLALEVADRARFEECRERILRDHTEHPMMWIFTSFLLDRHHDYWLFQVPFTAGWSYGRRESYFQSRGYLEDARRMLRTELSSAEGGALRIPEDLDSQWTAIVFAQPEPWSKNRDDGLPPSPRELLRSVADLAAARPPGDIKVVLAVLGENVEASRAALEESEPGVEWPLLAIPGGTENPLVHRLGILSEDRHLNTLLVDREGRIAAMLSGLALQGNRRHAEIITNIIASEDEKAISAALERGDVESAKQLIFALAPPFDPEAVDERGRALKKPVYSLEHLRSRARVSMALGDWDDARADIEEVIQRQLGIDGGMSLRTDELDRSERLRDEIAARSNAAQPPAAD